MIMRVEQRRLETGRFPEMFDSLERASLLPEDEPESIMRPGHARGLTQGSLERRYGGCQITSPLMDNSKVVMRLGRNSPRGEHSFEACLGIVQIVAVEQCDPLAEQSVWGLRSLSRSHLSADTAPQNEAEHEGDRGRF